MTTPALAYDFDVTPQLAASVQKALAARLRWYRWLQYAYAMFPLLFVGLSWFVRRSLGAAIIDNWFWIVALPLFGFVVLPWLTRRAFRRRFRSNPMLGGERSLTLREDGLAMESRAGSAVVRWPALLRVVESDEHFLFYYTPQCAYYLPRMAVPEDEFAAVREHIRNHVTVPTEFRAGIST